MEQWFQACLSLCLVGLCSMVLYLYYVAWLRPQSLRNKLRQQGIRGPPPSLLYGNSMEIKSLMAEKSRGGGGEIKHGFTPAMFPHLEQWTKVYGMWWLIVWSLESQSTVLCMQLNSILRQYKLIHRLTIICDFSICNQVVVLSFMWFHAGPVFCYSLGNLVVLHISHPKLVKEINLCSSLDLGKTPHLKKTHEPLFGQGILKSSGKVWSHQRKIIAPELSADKVKVKIMLHQV